MSDEQTLDNADAEALLENVGDDESLPEAAAQAASKDDKPANVSSNQQFKSKRKSRLGDYLHDLREENKTLRKESEEYLKKVEEARTQAHEASKKAEALTRGYEQRMVNLELEATAMKAGMINLDDVRRFADLSQVKVSEDGTKVLGAEDLIATLKKERPYLFQKPDTSNTSRNFNPPPADRIGVKDVSKLTPAEYAKERQQKLREVSQQYR